MQWFERAAQGAAKLRQLMSTRGGTAGKSRPDVLKDVTIDDTDHRLAPGELAAILQKAAPILSGDDLDVEIEYEDCQISQFPVENVSVPGDGLKN